MFTISQVLKDAWSTCKENLELSLFTTLLILGVSGLSDGRKGLGILAFIFLMIIEIGYTKIFLKISDGEHPKFAEIFEHINLFWKYIGLSILVGFVVMFGFILFIIPGVILLVRLSFASLILIDTQIGPIEAIKESWAITKGSFWKILALLLVLGLLNILGAILLVVGLLITIPVSTLAMIYVYRKLSQARASLIVEPLTTETPATA